MISPEQLRYNPFFAGLSPDHLQSVAEVAAEVVVPPGHLFFYEGDNLDTLYVLLDGAVALGLSVPETGCRAIIPLPQVRAPEVVVSVVRPREVFAWSALVPPFKATSNGRATERCRVAAVDCRELRRRFRLDPALGYVLMMSVAQVARDRLLDAHYEALADSLQGRPLLERTV